MIYFTGPIGEGKTVAVTGVVTVINALLGTSKVIKNGKIVTSQGDISHQSTATSNRLIIMTSRNPNDIFIILLDLGNIFVLGTFLNILSDGLNMDNVAKAVERDFYEWHRQREKEGEVSRVRRYSGEETLSTLMSVYLLEKFDISEDDPGKDFVAFLLF